MRSAWRLDFKGSHIELADKYFLLEDKDRVVLQDLYKQYRVPIQHWIYWRFINYIITNDAAKEEKVEKSIRKAITIEWEINWINNIVL